MISRLMTLENLFIRSVTDPTNNNSKDKNPSELVGAAAKFLFSGGSLYGLNILSRSLALRVIAQSPAQDEANLKWGLPLNVKKTLDKLFEGSRYHCVDALPFYPTILGADDLIEREKMEAPIMKGTLAGRRFIVIKIDSDLPDEVIRKCFSSEANSIIETNDRKIDNLLILYQSHKDGPGPHGLKDGALIWKGGMGNGVIAPQFLSWIFTDKDGSGPTDSQKDNFELTKNLIKNGSGLDTTRVPWSIPKK